MRVIGGKGPKNQIRSYQSEPGFAYRLCGTCAGSMTFKVKLTLDLHLQSRPHCGKIKLAIRSKRLVSEQLSIGRLERGGQSEGGQRDRETDIEMTSLYNPTLWTGALPTALIKRRRYGAPWSYAIYYSAIWASGTRDGLPLKLADWTTQDFCSPDIKASELFTVDHGSAYGYNLMYEVWSDGAEYIRQLTDSWQHLRCRANLSTAAISQCSTFLRWS